MHEKPYFYFEVIFQSTKSRARVGRIHTPHGIIETPNFVPVGTHAALKAVDTVLADSLDVQLMFCNTYHLMIQPGTRLIAQAGGLHRFMHRTKPLITDSGGFQVFSLAYGTVHEELKSKGKKKQGNSVVKINEDGVLFKSYKDGSTLLLTPESSVKAQKDLGADIIIPLDELPPYHISQTSLEQSLERTHRWEKRSLDEHKKNSLKQAMYAVIHGGTNPSLRTQSCQYLAALPFDGFAIGGSLGKSHAEMVAMLAHLMPQVPYQAPNHLLGIGDLTSLKACIPLGIDTFDSSHPTRCARHGLAFTRSHGLVKILHHASKNNFGPLEPGCTCMVCTHYSCAYIHHLFKAHELSAYTLVSIHNIHCMMQIMADYRKKILDGDL